MDPVSAAIDKTEELMGHSPHPAIVTVPLGAWAVSTVCDALGAVTGDRRYDDAARLSMAVGLIGAAGAAVTGIRDYGMISEDAPSHDIATKHGLLNAVVGSLMAASYVMRARDDQAGRPPSPSARLLGAAGSALSLYTGWLGGVLVSEYGEGVEPVMAGREAGSEVGASRGRERLSPEAPLGLREDA